ncbi:hypothetical protein Tco_1337905 [Tanacetum coccineum]
MQKNNSTIYCQQNSSSPNIHNQITTSKSIQDTAFGNSADVNNRVAYKDNYFLQKPACTGTDRCSNSCNSQVNNTGSMFFRFRSDKVVTYTENFPSLEMEDGGRCRPPERLCVVVASDVVELATKALFQGLWIGSIMADSYIASENPTKV